MRKASLDFLQNLLTTPSPSGFERQGQRVWLDYAEKFGEKTYTDTYGNAVVTLNPGAKKSVIIVGHADEIGLMVNYIDDSGYIYVKPIGGLDANLIPGKRVSIQTQKGVVRGVAGATAVHLQSKGDGDKSLKIQDVFIDVAAKDKAEVEKKGVRVGDPMTFVDDFELLDRNHAIARAFDNRIGTWIAAETLRLIKASKKKLNVAVHAASCVQEEIGSFGAQMVTEALKPDVGLITDVGHATDTPGIDPRKTGKYALGAGPLLAVGGAMQLELTERLEQVAKREKIPLHREAAPAKSWTDADVVFKANGGVATALVSLPIRYMHTTVELTDLRDLERIAQLFAAFCLSLKENEVFKTKI